MKKTGQMMLIGVSVLFTVFQLLIFQDPFHKESITFIIATTIAWFVGWHYDKLKYDQLRRKQSEENYRELIEMLPESVIIHRNFNILYVNKAAEVMLGARRKSELHGRSLLELMDANEAERLTSGRQKEESGQSSSVYTVCKLTCLHLKTIFYEFSSLSILFEGKEAVLYIGKDVTDQKTQTESLLQKSEKLAVVGQLAAGIAHEIRNPLTSIKGFIQLVHAEMAHPDHKEFLKIVLIELERINAIVGEFLVLAKPNAVKVKKTDLKPLLEDVVALINSQAIMDNVQIDIVYRTPIPAIVCEENQLKQVFINILKNGIEAMPGGGFIRVEAEESKGGIVSFAFTDQGVGIPQDRIPTLGEPFYTTKEKGTGLGLMTCFKIIDNHKGKLHIKSEIGKGTTVRVLLPAAPAIQQKDEAKKAWSVKQEETANLF